MKRVVPAWIVAYAGAYAACGGNSVTPSDRTSGGAASLGGDGGAGEGGFAGTGTSGTAMRGGTSGSTQAGGSATPGANGGSAGASVGGTTTQGGSSGPATPGGRGGNSSVGTGGSATQGGTDGDTTGGWSGSATQGGTGGDGEPLGGKGGSATGGTPIDGSGGGENTEDFSSLHGHTILMPCSAEASARGCTARVDDTRPCISPPGGPAAAYAGTHSHNEQITLGGTPGTRYVLTLRVRGLVEAKTYAGGMDQSNSGEQVPADGLYVGGATPGSTNGYSYYFIRSDSPVQHYYLNSIGTPSDSRVRPSVFEIDFTFEMSVDGGSTVCLVAADPTATATKNCADPVDLQTCNPVSLSNLDPLIAQDVGAQPYDGQFIGITVVNARRM